MAYIRPLSLTLQFVCFCPDRPAKASDKGAERQKIRDWKMTVIKKRVVPLQAGICLALEQFPSGAKTTPSPRVLKSKRIPAPGECWFKIRHISPVGRPANWRNHCDSSPMKEIWTLAQTALNPATR